MISDLIKPVLFKALYGSWEVTNALGIDKGSRANGYTVLLPVPADLPVFLQIALKSLLTQDQKHLVEILVIPDIPSDDFRVAFRKRKGYRSRGYGLVEMNRKDMVVGRLYRTPNVYYFLRILNGISSARSAHVLFHDADLFLFSKDFLKRHYETFLDRHVSVLGVDRRTIDLWRSIDTWSRPGR
jgi:hypothetical protein